MNKNSKIKLATIVVLFFGVLFLIYVLNKESKKYLTVAFLNVGQGDSIFIESPNGNQMLIDGGPNREVLRELSKVMPFYDRHIDVVAITHADGDHIGGIIDVLNNYRADLFLETGVSGGSNLYKELENLVNTKKEQNLQKIIVKRGMVIDLGGGATLQILYPEKIYEGVDTNDASIVAKLNFGNESFLLTGDSPKKIENYLVSLEQKECQGQSLNCPDPKGLSLALKSNVLKAGHHGSKTSSGESFVSAVSPKYAVISAGKNNKYGHPNQETLDVLNKFGIKILRTDEQGRIIFKTDGNTLQVE